MGEALASLFYFFVHCSYVFINCCPHCFAFTLRLFWVRFFDAKALQQLVNFLIRELSKVVMLQKDKFEFVGAKRRRD